MEQNDVDLKVKSQCALTNVFEDIMFGHKVYKMIFIMTINSFCLFWLVNTRDLEEKQEVCVFFVG